jgi:hypothetical protein
MELLCSNQQVLIYRVVVHEMLDNRYKLHLNINHNRIDHVRFRCYSFTYMLLKICLDIEENMSLALF